MSARHHGISAAVPNSVSPELTTGGCSGKAATLDDEAIIQKEREEMAMLMKWGESLITRGTALLESADEPSRTFTETSEETPNTDIKKNVKMEEDMGSTTEASEESDDNVEVNDLKSVDTKIEIIGTNLRDRLAWEHREGKMAAMPGLLAAWNKQLEASCSDLCRLRDETGGGKMRALARVARARLRAMLKALRAVLDGESASLPDIASGQSSEALRLQRRCSKTQIKQKRQKRNEKKKKKKRAEANSKEQTEANSSDVDRRAVNRARLETSGASSSDVDRRAVNRARLETSGASSSQKVGGQSAQASVDRRAVYRARLETPAASDNWCGNGQDSFRHGQGKRRRSGAPWRAGMMLMMGFLVATPAPSEALSTNSAFRVCTSTLVAPPLVEALDMVPNFGVMIPWLVETTLPASWIDVLLRNLWKIGLWQVESAFENASLLQEVHSQTSH